MTTLGSTTRTIFLNHESHKLHLEFTVGTVAVKKGQPVKIHTDGTVIPMLLADAGTTHPIGYAIMDAAIGENVTIVVRGNNVLYCYSKGLQDAGPGIYDSFYTDPLTGEAYNVIDDGVYANQQGWILDASTGANELIRFLTN